MPNKFAPDIFITSVFDLDLRMLKSRGISNIIIDIDNTLSKWGSAKPDSTVCDWIGNVRGEGFKICILSNSSNKRVETYCSGLDVLHVRNVRKPMKSSFINAMGLLCSDASNTCVVGDQIFTDIIGGNSCGLYTVLVAPIDKNEFFITRLIRKLEKLIINKALNR